MSLDLETEIKGQWEIQRTVTVALMARSSGVRSELDLPI
jgi:hypothetical protein